MGISVTELGRMYKKMGPAKTVRHLRAAITEGLIKLDEFSVQDLYVGLVENGEARLRAMRPRKSGGLTLLEANQAVDTTAFSNLTGQIIYSRVLEEFNQPEFLYKELFDEQQTDFLDGEKIPGIHGLGDGGEMIAEADEYPTIGLSEKWVQTGKLVKRGFIVPVTREIIIADRLGLVLEMAGKGAHYMGCNCEKRGLDVALGVTNNYNYMGSQINTYLGAGAYVNTLANTPLVDYRSLEAAKLIFDAIVDPGTGEPILLTPDTLVVPTALEMTAGAILSAQTVERVDNQANSMTIRTIGGNPIKSKIKVLSNAYVKARTGSASTWFYGQPKKAFRRYYAWDIETDQAGSNTEAGFTRDVNMRFKVGLMDHFQTVEPRYMQKITA